jgi:UDP:flavonoid glycosyltransferase YjiC (YdhE family)
MASTRNARAEGLPVAHVPQGTLDVDLTDLLKPTIAGLDHERMLVVCTTGGAPVSALGPLPHNVRAARFLPHDQLLPLTDVMVTNGGWGGVLAAVQAGVPLVVAGASLDKPEVARRVAWSGVGKSLHTGRPGAARVRREVRQVLAQPEPARRASELGAMAAGGAGAAATLLEEMVAGEAAA